MDRDLSGRVDVDTYHRGCSVLENFELFQTGAIRRRCGSRFIADLGEMPLTLGAFRWSDGRISLVVVMEHEIRVYSSVSGVLVFKQAYDAIDAQRYDAAAAILQQIENKIGSADPELTSAQVTLQLEQL